MLWSLRSVYVRCWRYAFACPVLFSLPIVTEAMQHVAEYSQGFYADLASAKANEHSMLRMAFGTVKILSVLIARYWVIRWLEWGDGKRTFGFDGRSIATFTPWLIFEAAITFPTIWLPVFAPSLGRPVMILSIISFVLCVLFSDWSRAASIGQSGGPVRSARKVAPIFLWALAFNLIALLPIMTLHYALMMVAMNGHHVIRWIVLAADTIVVGYLSAIVCGVPWFVSEHALARFDVRHAKLQ